MVQKKACGVYMEFLLMFCKTHFQENKNVQKIIPKKKIQKMFYKNYLRRHSEHKHDLDVPDYIVHEVKLTIKSITQHTQSKI